MDSKNQTQRGWRGSADVWLDAAYQALVQSGVESVKVMPLAQSLGLSRTSFYWHFADREALLAALIAKWRAGNTQNLIDRTKAPADRITGAVLNLFDCWITPELFDSALEFSMRNWSQIDPALAETLAQEDERRLNALREMFLRYDYSTDQADIRARTIYLTQVGYIAMRATEDRHLRLARMPTYVEAFTGVAPTAHEIAHFLNRHSD